MKDFLLSLDEDLVKEVDSFVDKHGTNRSEFTRRALRNELQRQREAKWEQEMIESYRKIPQQDEEFGSLFTDQVVPDEDPDGSD